MCLIIRMSTGNPVVGRALVEVVMSILLIPSASFEFWPAILSRGFVVREGCGGALGQQVAHRS